MKFFLCSLTTMVALPSFGEDGNAVLRRIDGRMAGDGSQEATMRVIEPGGATRERKFKNYQKGKKRLVRFYAPADVKGMTILVENTDTTYVYLPAYSRVRRIAGHTKHQSFMGSDFSYEDMGDISWEEKFAAKISHETAESWHLDLTPRNPEDSEYSRGLMEVSKKFGHFVKIEYFDKSGRKAKTHTQADFYQDAWKTWVPKKIVMTDHRRGDHRTEIDLALSPGEKLPDSLFSLRTLERGE